MKAQRKLYIFNDMFTLHPQIQISYEEIALLVDDEAQEYLKALTLYDDFCRSQTTTGQKRKNQRSSTRKKIFKKWYRDHDLEDRVRDQISSVRLNLEQAKVAMLPYHVVTMDYYGRLKKSTVDSFWNSVELACNTGGTVSEYYARIGLHGFVVEEKVVPGED